MLPTPILLGTHEPYTVGERQHIPFTLDPAQHTYVIGASGSGKTHLLRNILIQMIARGDGVGFLDPHGDTAVVCVSNLAFKASFKENTRRTRTACYLSVLGYR